MEEKIKRLVDRIIVDLTGRRGLKHEWYAIDEDIQQEIRDSWEEIAREVLS